MKTVPGVRQVALLAGVSRSTVSNVLNHPQRVDPDTKERVLTAIKKLNYVPNSMARVLTTGESNVVGLILPGLRSSLFLDMARAAQEAARAAGMHLLIADSDAQASREEQLLNYFDSSGARAILIAPGSENPDPINRVSQRGRRVIVINHLSKQLSINTVAVNEELAGDMAVRYLVNAGCKSIIWVGGLAGYQAADRRKNGALDCLEQLGTASLLAAFDDGGLAYEHGAELAERIAGLDAADSPIGIVVASASKASGLLHKLQSMGVTIPGRYHFAACEGDDDILRSTDAIAVFGARGEDLGITAMYLISAPQLEDGQPYPDPVTLISPTLLRDSHPRITFSSSRTSPPAKLVAE